MIFFVALKDDLNYGSTDMATMIEKLGKLTKDDPYKNETYVKRHMRCILAARFFILNQLLNTVDYTPKKWLLIQLVMGDNDCFKDLTHIFRACPEKHLEDTLINLMSSVRQKINCKIPVFLDEAQSLVFEYDGYFFSNDKRAFRPLYSSVVRSVLVHDDYCTLTVSGTGLRMKEAMELSGSHVGKGSIETILVTMDTFFSIDKVVSFTQDHLKFNLDDWIAEWLVGRPRILCLFLEKLVLSDGDVVISEFEKYKTSMTSTSENSRSLLECYSTMQKRA